jgi:5-hydroxyisourate hydrolase-like protein (transthyretin family)
MILKRALLIVLFLSSSAVAILAQYQGRISGHVLDPSGNPVENAEVTIVSQRTSSVRYESKSDKDGRFVQFGLMPGYFMVTVKKAGFAPASREIKVGVAGEETVEITLKVVQAEAEKTYSAADKLFLKGNKLYAEQKYADAYFQIGTILIGQNKAADACAALEKFLALAPGHEKAGVAKQLLEYLKK